MKTEISTLLKSFAILLFSSLFFTRAGAQCQANWVETSNGCTVAFTNTSTGTNASTKYYWTFGDGQKVPGQNPVHTYLASGVYSVSLAIVTMSPVCDDSLRKNVTVQCGATGVADLLDEQSISIYPNPSSGKFTLVIANETKIFQLEIYNVMGEKVYSWNSGLVDSGKTNPPVHQSTIDLSSQPNGIYFLKISALSDLSFGGKTENGIAVQKLIIQK